MKNKKSLSKSQKKENEMPVFDFYDTETDKTLLTYSTNLNDSEDNQPVIRFGLINLKKLKGLATYESRVHFNSLCPYCKENIYGDNERSEPEVDHFIPIARGGQDFPWNILAVCKRCNREKKDKMPYEFLDEETYNECNEYLKTVLFKHTKQHTDLLQIASQVEFFAKQHIKRNINDEKLIDSIYKILDLKRVVVDKVEKEPEPEFKENKHIGYFWDSLNIKTNIQESKYFKRSVLYIKDEITQRIYVSIRKSYPIYVKYCLQNGIPPETEANLRSFFTKSNYLPFIKSNQKNRGHSITKSGFGSSYCFRYEISPNKPSIIIGDKEILL